MIQVEFLDIDLTMMPKANFKQIKEAAIHVKLMANEKLILHLLL
jgi:hypothetical protein